MDNNGVPPNVEIGVRDFMAITAVDARGKKHFLSIHFDTKEEAMFWRKHLLELARKVESGNTPR